MKPGKINLPCYRGQSMPIRFAARSKNTKQPLDLTGATVIFTAWTPGRAPAQVPSFTKRTGAGLTWDPATGYVSGRIGWTATAAQELASYNYLDYAVEIRWPDGGRDRLLEGRINFSDARSTGDA